MRGAESAGLISCLNEERPGCASAERRESELSAVPKTSSHDPDRSFAAECAVVESLGARRRNRILRFCAFNSDSTQLGFYRGLSARERGLSRGASRSVWAAEQSLSHSHRP